MQALLFHRSRLLLAISFLSVLSFAAFTSTPVKVRTIQSQASISRPVQSSEVAVVSDNCPAILAVCTPIIIPPQGLYVGPDGSAPADLDEFSM